MSSIYQLKSRFQALLSPLVHLLDRANISANQVTICTLISSLLMAGLLATTHHVNLWFTLPLFMFLRMAANAIDGMLAKHQNKQTETGFILNELADLLADAALILAFGSINGFDSKWLISLLLLSWLTEIIALLTQISRGQRDNSGPLGKSDRAVYLSIFALLIAYEFDTLQLSTWFFVIGHVLLLYTCFNRLRHKALLIVN